MDGTARGGFQEFERRRAELLDLAKRLVPVVDGIDVVTCRDTLTRLRDRVEADTFKVMIVGEFKRGKSTFINALLGEQVLPMHSLPCTAVINEVKFSEKKRAVLHPMAGAESLDPVEISVESLVDYVTIRDGESRSTSPYARAEVFWPLPLCENRVEIIDSPGLNEAPEREIITLGYLDQADAMVVVMLATSPVSLNEQAFLDVQVTARGHDDAFYIFNRINDIDAEELEDAKRGIRNRLSPYSVRENRIFFVDAKTALRSRIAGDSEGFARSGVAKVEETLEDFLARDRGRAKLLVSARHLKSVVSDTRRNMTMQRGMLQRSADELRKAYDEAQGPLNQLERSRISILKRVDSHTAETVRQVEVMTRGFYRTIGRDIETWVLDMELEAKLSGIKNMNPIGLQKRAEAVQAEVSQKLSHKLQAAVATWTERDLRTLVESRLADLEIEIGDDLRDLLAKADAIRYTLAAVDLPPALPTVSSATERVAAAGAGLVLGGPGMALIGANFGFQGVVKAIMPAIGVAIVGTVIGLAMLPLVAAMAAVGVFQGMKMMGSVEKKIKQDVAKGYSDHIRDNQDSLVSDLVGQVSEQLAMLRDIISQGVEADLASVRQEAEAALQKREAGEAATRTALRELDDFAHELETVDDELAEFITGVAV